MRFGPRLQFVLPMLVVLVCCTDCGLAGDPTQTWAGATWDAGSARPRVTAPQVPPARLKPHPDSEAAPVRVAQVKVERQADGRSDELRRLPASRVSSTGFSTAGLMLLFVGGIAGGTWLLFSRKESRLPARAPQQSPLSAEALLELLIQNRLPVVVEALVLPPLAQIHGRPVANVRYRAETAHPLCEPHFAPAPEPLPTGTAWVDRNDAFAPVVAAPHYRVSARPARARAVERGGFR